MSTEELDYQLYRIIMWCITAIIIAAIVTMGGCTAYTTKLYTESGYTQETLPGANGPNWVRK